MRCPAERVTELAVSVVRLCEWGHTSRHDLTEQERQALIDSAVHWQKENRFSAPPLAFSGTDGRTLVARQYVGVVEASGRTVEIYPKLDTHLVQQEEVVEDSQAASVMRSLLWMLDVADVGAAAEANTAALQETPTQFLDLFAYLLGKNLRAELSRGVARSYEGYEDELAAVRGRIRIVAQVGGNWNRMDRIACGWDEFTPDTAINQLLRCTCRQLARRARHAQTALLLQECLGLLEDVSDVSIATALHGVTNLRHWDRSTERFRRSFELAHRLLRGFGHSLAAGQEDTFVFLLDMNVVFESYVRAVLEARFGVAVEEQRFVGQLLDLRAGGIRQYADFYFRDQEGAVWIGDAKYKHLAAEQAGAARFASASGAGEEATLRSQRVDPADVRQLTVYAELDRLRGGHPGRANLLLLYPFVGASAFAADQAMAWNGSTIYLAPVRVTRVNQLRDNFPSLD